MNICLFSQSLFALNLSDAIVTTSMAGFSAIELACTTPHFDVETARKQPERVVRQVRDAGLGVAALSLFNNFTDPDGLDARIEAAAMYIRLAPVFETDLVKLTPGPPGSAEAAERHWQGVLRALDALIPLAREVGVRLAFETHMRQLTDTLASSLRLLEMTPADVVGLTVDFSNLSFAGEDMTEAIPAFGDRIFHTHVKNGHIDAEGGWYFHALDRGLTDYAQVISLLRRTGYGGYLSLECLGEDARQRPLETVCRDVEMLKRYLG